MARKNSLRPEDDRHQDDQLPSDNRDEGNLGDAHELEGALDGFDFDPNKLEADIPSTPGAPANHDPYDPAHLGMSQDFVAEAGVAKKWDIIKVEKPGKSRVFRVHPTMRLKTVLLTLKEDNETYLVLPNLRQALVGESLCGVYTLLACITKAGTPFLWPIRMADSDGKWNVWHQSAWQIAENAQKRWARMQANRDAGHYVAEYDQRPPAQQQPPNWPELAFRDWLELAFHGFTIDSLEHPVLKRLRMED
jgi:hypothetical protein